MTTSHQPETSVNPWLGRFSLVFVAATLALIFLGGQVKSHDAGLSVPDWPTSYGQNMFLFPISEWNGGIFHEQLHRIVASSIGLMTLVLWGWLLRVERREWVRTLGIVAVGGVIAQGALGGMTVLFVQPAWMSSMHGVLAQSFFMLAIFIGYALSKERARRESTPDASGRDASAKALVVMMACVYVQLILGAFMRHTESGLAIPDFPLMAGQVAPWFTSASVEWVDAWRVDYAFETGRVLPEITLGQIWIHFVHRAGAVVVAIALAHVLFRTYSNRSASPRMWRQTLVLAGLVAVQVGLGVTTVLTQRVPLIASIHLAMGASILGYSTLLVLRAFPLGFGTAVDEAADIVPDMSAQKAQM